MDYHKLIEELKLELTTIQKKQKECLTFEHVGKYINSNQFMRLFAKTNREYDSFGNLVGIALDYVDIFGRIGTASLEELEEILNKSIHDSGLVASHVETAFFNKILKDLGFNKKELTSNEEEKLKLEMIKIFMSGQTKFHAFNGCFLESIKEKGINPKCKQYEKEMLLLDDLHKKYDVRECVRLFKSDEGQISYSLGASFSYSYALLSPEWFGKLCGSEFIVRNYEKAKKEFEDRAERNGFSDEDKNKYLSLFKYCWNKFCNGKLYLAAIREDKWEYEHQFLNMLKYIVSNNPSELFGILFDLKCGIGGDLRQNEPIDTKNANFIELPSVDELNRRLESLEEDETFKR